MRNKILIKLLIICHSVHTGIQETGNYLNEQASTKVVGGRINVETVRLEEQVPTNCE